MNNLTNLVLDYMESQVEQRIGTEILGGGEDFEDIVFASYRRDGHVHALFNERQIEDMILQDWDEYKEVIGRLLQDGLITEEDANPLINPRYVVDIVYQEMMMWLLMEVNFTEDLVITANGVWLNEQTLDKITEVIDGLRVIEVYDFREDVYDILGNYLYG